MSTIKLILLIMLNSNQLQDLISKSLRYLLIIGTIAPITSLEARPVQANPPSSAAPPKEAIAPIPAESKDYTLGEGDKVRVTIYQVADLSGDFLVLADGTLTLPLIGSVKVEGMTVTEAGQTLAKRYTTYLKRPVVTVSVLTPRPLQIAIAGEVNRPGTYTINPEQSQKTPLLTEIIRQAGGVTTVADIGQVQIRRNLKGQEQLIQANLWQLIQKGDTTQDISLRDGDSIVIPTKTTLSVGEVNQLADANFGLDSDREINVTVVGEVYRPGSHRIVPNQVNTVTTENNRGIRRQPARLTQAIQQAGGIKPLADIRQVQVLRYTRDGSQQKIPVDLWSLLEKGDITGDIFLQEGDTVIIPTATEISAKESETLASASFAPKTINVKVVGEVKKPGIIEVPPNTPLNQAILTAGDFDKRRANQSTVELIRLNPNGTVTKTSINIDFSQGINEKTNPILRNNDVVVVHRSGLASATDTLGTVLSPFTGLTGLFNGFLNLFR
ncbi:MAG: sugar ABC transporter substrate-binding protein [Microcystis aeruginosa Ma_SC_T_19800800_S464]|uniref:Sugar ABC transporter substrate-binding protein n=1 Tax=Microcystis aeruginosa Ma_SC_T_19800800_S464 TaxID=2486257 RepID=A0A552E444_MICAE|nr:MAG: sugar ABC transporter substrate-binding protein [Microcystis aeruginosa Ma_SC_T_19800800_S464]